MQKNKFLNRNTLLIVIILVISFLIRFWQLDKNPVGFFCDEASVGYDAWKIIETGKDRHGDSFPLFFKGFNFDNISPYHVYLNIPFILAFGLNEMTVRLTPVFWSVVELFFFYILLKEFIPNSFALLGMLLLSISPWHFHISRINVGDYYSWTLLTSLAFLWITKAFKKKETKFFLLSAVFLGLATYSYTPARLIMPLLSGLAILIVFSKKYFRPASLMTIVYLIVLIPFISFHLTDPHSLQRIRDTTQIKIDNKQTPSWLNKNFISSFAKKYLSHYSNNFLFKKGDTDFPGQFIRRHSISGMGLFYPYQKWLTILGLGWVIWEILIRKRSELWFLISLLLLWPVADSLTTDGTPFATRSYLGILPLHMLIAFGINSLFQIFLKLPLAIKPWVKNVSISIVFILICFSTFNLFEHFIANPLTTSDFWGWQYGPRDTMKYFLEVKNNYDELYLSGEFNGSTIFTEFYDPKNSCQGKCKIGDFWRAPEIYNPTKRQLFSLSPEYLNNSPLKSNFVIKKTLYYPDGEPAFLIGEVSALGNLL